jgi:hypothetical protein
VEKAVLVSWQGSKRRHFFQPEVKILLRTPLIDLPSSLSRRNPPYHLVITGETAASWVHLESGSISGTLQKCGNDV